MATFKSTNGDYVITVASGTGNLSVVGNITTSGSITGNIIGPTMSVVGNVTVGNLISLGIVTANADIGAFGNVYAGGFVSAVGNIITPANFSGATVKTTPVLFSALPAASSIGAGSRAFITDANTTTFGSQVSGSAGNSVPVYSNGTNWYVG
jgi:hypothetical protein